VKFIGDGLGLSLGHYWDLVGKKESTIGTSVERFRVADSMWNNTGNDKGKL
jgi:hypothetical protein